MASPDQDCDTVDAIIKIESENTDPDLQIKIENEDSQNSTTSSSHKNVDIPINAFDNVQIEIKQELESCLEKGKNQSVINTNELISPSPLNIYENIKAAPETAFKVETDIAIDDASLVTYDYPDFADSGSMDSNEATALGRVEACLQDDNDIKTANQGGYCVAGEDCSTGNNKLIPDLTVTETHLIANKVINTTSTVTNPQDGYVKSQTTKTLVMEILPMHGRGKLCKISNPEEILPTTQYDDYEKINNFNSFQLNSITGDILTLEQEAFGVLKTKRSRTFVYNCPKCVKVYNSKSTLSKHLKVHETIERREQGQIQSKKTRLENQLKKIKAEEELFKPKVKLPLKQEIGVKKEGYQCTCGKNFRRRTRMETCLRTHEFFDTENKCYSCISCKKQFKSKDELALHRKRLHNRKRFLCKFCPTDYDTQKELLKHLQKHQKVQQMEYKVLNEIVKGKNKLKCFMCIKTYSELSELKNHVMEDHKEPYVCPHCKRTFSKIIDFGNHTKTYHPEVEGQSVLDVLEAFSKLVKAWKCEECELQFHEPDKLALHQVASHHPDVKPENQFQCIDCRRVFITKQGLKSHRRVHHNNEKTDEAEVEDKGIMCLECRKMCEDMKALTSHMRLHSPDRKYPCKFCDFRFATPEKKKAHAEIHTGDMKYVCFICEYQCSSENRLKKHKTSIKHFSMKEYLLTGKPLMEESTLEKPKDSSRSNLSNQKKRKKKEDYDSVASSSYVIVFTCDICEEKFPSEAKMLDHKESHPFIEIPCDGKTKKIFFK